MQRPVQIDFIDMPEHLQSKYQYSTEGAIGRLRAAGYAAAITPFADAIDEYVRHYLAHDRRLGDEVAQPAISGVS
jgi:ADP-L-glycero-D-manno-heptose 6-epimerase